MLGLIRDTLVDAFAAADLDEPFLQQQLQADFLKPLMEEFLSIAPVSRTR